MVIKLEAKDRIEKATEYFTVGTYTKNRLQEWPKMHRIFGRALLMLMMMMIKQTQDTLTGTLLNNDNTLCIKRGMTMLN